jgi:beta-lactamase regulating signal transducer with metallopeptidase domain
MISTDLSPLANHLWQSTFCVAIAWLLTLALGKNRAAVRYRLWLAASVKFLIPFSILVSAGSHLGWRTPPAVVKAPLSLAIEQISQPFSVPVTSLPMAAATLPTNPVRLLLFAVWLCGFTVSAIVWLRCWHRFRADLRSATPLPLDLPVPVMASPNRLEPGVLGIRKPVLLLPEGIMTRLTQAQLQSILAHELCHVRRRDNLAQRFTWRLSRSSGFTPSCGGLAHGWLRSASEPAMKMCCGWATNRTIMPKEFSTSASSTYNLHCPACPE